MNAPDDFERELRGGLATLALEAVPDENVTVSELPPMEPTSPRSGRRFDVRLLAAGIAAAILTASVVAVVALRTDPPPERLGPRPVWTKVARSPLSPRSAQAAAFTGREVIIWGGRSDSAGGVTTPVGPSTPRYTLGDGAAYDVARNRWRVLPRAPIVGRYDAIAVWTGTEVLVVGGDRDHATPGGGIGFLRNGAAYDPAQDRWRRIPDAPGCPQTGAWTGTRLVVSGICADRPNGNKTFYAEYDPARDQWTSLPARTYPVPLVAAGGRVYAWDAGTGRGAVLDAGAQRWTRLPSLPGGPRFDSHAFAFGDHLAVAGYLEKASDDVSRGYATVDVLVEGQWQHDESTEVTSWMSGSELASSGDAVVWSAGPLGLSVWSGAPTGARWSTTDAAPSALGAVGQTLLGIGPGRFFAWGGRLAGTSAEPTNRPTAQGVILRVP